MKKYIVRFLALCWTIGILQFSCTTQEGTFVGTDLKESVLIIVESGYKNARVFINQREYSPLQNGKNSYSHVSGTLLAVTLFYPGYGFSDTIVPIAEADTTTIQFTLFPVVSGSVAINTDSGVSVLINDLPFAVTNSTITTLEGLPHGNINFTFIKGSSVAADSLIIPISSTISYSPIIGLAQRILIEHFSNVNCNGCPEKAAVLEDVLDSLNSPLVRKIAFHASWPSPYDPLYIAAKVDQKTRVDYYQLRSLPAFIVNGIPIVYNAASNEDLRIKLVNVLSQAIEKTPHYSIAIHLLSKDSGVVVVKAEYRELGAATLRIAAAQGTQEFSSPPGTNGEKHFTNVFKGFYQGNRGISITCGLGESTTIPFQFSLAELPEDDIWYYAWLQDDTSHEIVQSSWVKK